MCMMHIHTQKRDRGRETERWDRGILVTEVDGEYRGDDNIDSVKDGSCLKLTDFTWFHFHINERSQEKLYFYNCVHELLAAKARL